MLQMGFANGRVLYIETVVRGRTWPYVDTGGLDRPAMLLSRIFVSC